MLTVLTAFFGKTLFECRFFFSWWIFTRSLHRRRHRQCDYVFSYHFWHILIICSHVSIFQWNFKISANKSYICKIKQLQFECICIIFAFYSHRANKSVIAKRFNRMLHLILEAISPPAYTKYLKSYTAKIVWNNDWIIKCVENSFELRFKKNILTHSKSFQLFHIL